MWSAKQTKCMLNKQSIALNVKLYGNQYLKNKMSQDLTQMKMFLVS